MYRRGRPIDPVFTSNEALYCRIRQTDYVPGSSLNVRSPDFSVNRSKYSEPEDVLIPKWLDWGIVAFRVDAIPSSLTSAGGIEYRFEVLHAPDEDNYAHSEVHTLKGEQRDPADVPKTVKKVFRQVLSERVWLIKPPQT